LCSEAQLELPQARSQATFRATADLVRLDVSVLDRTGRPVRRLSAADFVVKEAGHEHTIEAFAEVESPVFAPASSWAAGFEPDVVRNDDAQEGRLWVIVLDDATIPPSPLFVSNAKLIARQILDRMGPADRAAIVFTRDSKNGQDFTASRRRLNTAIDSLTSGFNFTGGLGSRQNPDDYWWESSVITVATAAKYLSELPDRRKVLVYVSVGLPIDPDTLAGVELGAGGLSPSESMRRLASLLDLALRNAQAANVSVYAIDPGGLAGLEAFFMGARRMRQVDAHARARNHLDSLKAIAENTGGRALVDTNDFEPGIDRMFLENSAYYLIGFRPADRPDGRRLRPVEVTVRRPDVTVRSRRGYYSPMPTGGNEGPSPILPLTTAMAGVLPVNELPLQVSAAAFPIGDGARNALAVTIGIRKTTLQTSLGPLQVAVRAFTPEGHQQAGEELAITAPEVDRTGDLICEVLSRLDVPSGRYQLRIAARFGPSGPAGSVYYDLDVPDIRRAPLSLSGLVFGRDSGVPASPAGRFLAVLPLVPTTVRTFENSDRVRAFLEVSQGRGQPESIALTASIRDPSGVIAWQESQSFDPGAFSGRRTAGHGFNLALAGLRNGVHVLRVEAKRGSTQVSQQITFRMQ
jgi:VWFA-related protein